MRKLMHHLTFVSLTVGLAAGSVFPAFAVPDQTSGPGYVEESQEQQVSDPSESFIDTEIPQETPATENPVPSESVTSTSYIQIQLLDSEAMNWSQPIANGALLQTGGSGALSLCIYSVNDMRGDVLYRTYSSSTGWTTWTLNGDHTPWTAGVPIEAVQIRLNGQIADAYHVYYSAVLSDGTTCGWASDGSTSGAIAAGKYITEIGRAHV